MARILLIEPNTILAQTYQEVLLRHGHTVLLSDTAQGAISKADGQQPDLVILELQLAAHNGIEFLYEFRSYPDWQTIPVVIHSMIPEHVFGMSPVLWSELSISAYLYKPQTTLRQLLRTTEDHLNMTSHEAA